MALADTMMSPRPLSTTTAGPSLEEDIRAGCGVVEITSPHKRKRGRAPPAAALLTLARGCTTHTGNTIHPQVSFLLSPLTRREKKKQKKTATWNSTLFFPSFLVHERGSKMTEGGRNKKSGGGRITTREREMTIIVMSGKQNVCL